MVGPLILLDLKTDNKPNLLYLCSLHKYKIKTTAYMKLAQNFSLQDWKRSETEVIYMLLSVLRQVHNLFQSQL